MAAGARNRRLTLLRARLVEGEAADTTVYDDVGTVWASFDPISDGERARAGQLGGGLQARFRILWSLAVADLGANDQVRLAAKRTGEPVLTFGISGVKPHGPELEITATALTDRAA